MQIDLKKVTVDIEGSNLQEHPRNTSAKLGLVYLEPAANELFVDLDNEDAYHHLLAMLDCLHYNDFHVEILGIYTSKSGLPHRHAYLRAPRDLTVPERIALQAVLGSDRKREALSFLRYAFQMDRPATTFFETKEFVRPR